MEQVSENRCFGGRQLRFKHESSSTNIPMHFSVFLPSSAETAKVPALFWLSGLTCTDENFVQKAGAQRYAEEFGMALIAPDTSPRGESVADDPDGGWDFGLGAGFYVDATEAPFAANYQMYSYISRELPELIKNHFPVDPRRFSISGHSMGGHGALTIAIKHPKLFRSVSAFAPICAPSQCPWGQKALTGYLGSDQATWREYDTCALVTDRGCDFQLLVDQGSSDQFLLEQLQPDLLQKACLDAEVDLTLRIRDGYDHSYFYIASFIGEHIRFHAESI
ncbi:S-formylglutathione hydrolase [Biformimicrobium ophioploci]|uniref:S-formylglutathione hydrolase n=1 Tax=Biformimicrobium ophioploci TaxID=3036711 RepID=A0ABQ6LX38_9GAMM|nr:S-formylglutathione hydrolase [Microbulbifer sp. NKW57]GMG86672.1 S-formylglutathione hydrolase [Microbulbifer sp. NKW57]